MKVKRTIAKLRIEMPAGTSQQERARVEKLVWNTLVVMIADKDPEGFSTMLIPNDAPADTRLVLEKW
jgi:hypothetical protein